MTWFFFMDESGHDHRTTPYEVHGGIALHVQSLWQFVRDVQDAELRCFGCRLQEYGKEIKGSTLLDRKRFSFAAQAGKLRDAERRRLCSSFLAKGQTGETPRHQEFTAYGQASLLMARETFTLLKLHEAVLMASLVPKGVVRPRGDRAEHFLRKDIVYLLERYFYLLEGGQEHGVLVMDETDKQEDRRFVARLERYFTRTVPGRLRAEWIVPTPFFVSSDMAYAVQAADLCIYCINWGYRRPRRRIDAERREDIADMFGRDMAHLEFRGRGHRHGRVFESTGIFLVEEPYDASARR